MDFNHVILHFNFQYLIFNTVIALKLNLAGLTILSNHPKNCNNFFLPPPKKKSLHYYFLFGRILVTGSFFRVPKRASWDFSVFDPKLEIGDVLQNHFFSVPRLL